MKKRGSQPQMFYSTRKFNQFNITKSASRAAIETVMNNNLNHIERVKRIEKTRETNPER